MNSSIFQILPTLEPFNYSQHFEGQFKDKEWVLINGINDKKVTYIFKPNNVLKIVDSGTTIKTTWSFINSNFLSIQSEDGIQLVKIYYKGQDMMVMNQRGSDDYVMFVNQTNYDEDLETEEDLRRFLHKKYVQRASELIKKHQFYYIQNSEEFGPFTVEELNIKVQKDELSHHCFVRDINEDDYSSRLRIRDLLREI
ncbi:hypothetical protein [Mangrovimonas sp. ST2L15]|uniref:hypothetical protein n=1 Tax=Mangrovimonas sp. ST2L15 TaxID=1645916 RepID=UPI0006B52F02|nr:hypothetical protein [Mangrovimonas sp. ST2L15]